MDVMQRMMPVERAAYDRTVESLRMKLGGKAYAVACAEGRTMTPKAILAAQEHVTMQLLPRSPTAPSYPDDLTIREVEVLRLLAQGLTDAQIAAHLVISPRTVNKHITTIYSKIGVSSRAAATRYAIEHQLV